MDRAPLVAARHVLAIGRSSVKMPLMIAPAALALASPTPPDLPARSDQAAQRGAAEAPARIDAAQLGRPAFEERFRTLDAGSGEQPGTAPRRWRTVFGYGGPTSRDNRSSSEGAVYVDPAFPGVENGKLGTHPLGLDPFSTGAGGLTITARRVPAALRPKLFGREWMSGLLTSRNSFAMPWGYWEMEADLPLCEKGAWSGFWLLPREGKWPDNGEVDFPETIGDGTLYFSTHFKGNAAGGLSGGRTQEHHPASGCTRGLHRYGVRITPRTVAFYYDRAKVAEQPTPDGFGKPMFLLMNLAMRGPWADSKGLPSPKTGAIRMRVAAVRAWPIVP